MRKILLANHSIARGAFEAGVTVATAYPGTPSTEITESISQYDEIYVEWSPNEKVALEVAVGACYAGARALCSMKHVGLNVAADPLFTLSYTGVNGGLVIAVADDPGVHSSQNEQDSRYYALSSSVPMLEPSNSQEAKDFIKLAYEISEEYDTPCFVRLTTRVAHSQSIVEIQEREEKPLRKYTKDITKYAMMPSSAKVRHVFVEQRTNKLAELANTLEINKIEYKDKKLGVVCAGVIYEYVKDVLPEASILKLGMVFPLPDKLIREFASNVDELLVIEESSPFFETHIKALGISCHGRDVFSIQGEITASTIKSRYLGQKVDSIDRELPVRPPVMCSGCPHRGVFYVLKKLRLMVSADIGCYTLGAQPPLSAVDLVLCMGASIGMAHGINMAHKGKMSNKLVAVIGDSTFVHSGITGVVDTVYNKGVSTIIILDNSTTGMTGHQDHPGTGVTIKDEQTHQLDLEKVVRACGVRRVITVDAYDMTEVERVLRTELEVKEVSVIIAKRPCVLLYKGRTPYYLINQESCTKCKACLRVGCPALEEKEDKTIFITADACTGCGVCTQLCRFEAMDYFEVLKK